jgi:hypothetical protein
LEESTRVIFERYFRAEKENVLLTVVGLCGSSCNHVFDVDVGLVKL